MAKYRRSANRGGSGQLNRVLYKFEDNLNDSGALGDDIVPYTTNTNWSYQSGGLQGKYLKFNGGGKFGHITTPKFELADERGDCPFAVTIAFKKERTADFTNGHLINWCNSAVKKRFEINHNNGVVSAALYTGGATNNTDNYLRAELTASGTNINDDFSVGDWIIIQARYSGNGKWKSDSLELIMNKTYSVKSTETGSYDGMQEFGKNGSLQTAFSIGTNRYGGGIFRYTGFDSVLLSEGDQTKADLDDLHDDIKNGNTINLL